MCGYSSKGAHCTSALHAVAAQSLHFNSQHQLAWHKASQTVCDTTMKDSAHWDCLSVFDISIVSSLGPAI